MNAFRTIISAVIAGILLVFAGCGRKDQRKVDASGKTLFHVRLQTDWYPQGEHGGFYYALAMGYYAQEGLDVDILPGGITYMGALKVTEGQADFAMNKAEAILRHVDQGMPLRIVMATFQHDPQGIMLHADSPVKTFADLNGRKLMAMPGGTWLAYLEKEYGFEPVLIPSDKGMERFFSDPDLAQQCMITSEPFYASLKGVKTRVLLLKNSGFDPYHVVYTSDAFAAAHPDLVQAFVRASIRGWRDFLTKDPAPAFETIKARNSRQTGAQLNYARNLLIEGGYAMGDGGPEGYGRIDDARMMKLSSQMLDLGVINKMPESSVWNLAPKE